MDRLNGLSIPMENRSDDGDLSYATNSSRDEAEPEARMSLRTIAQVYQLLKLASAPVRMGDLAASWL